MSSFKDPLIIVDNGDETFTLYKGFTYHVGDLDSDIKIVVPEGFRSDFASLPRFLWSIIPPYGKHGKAAFLHDFLYEAVRRQQFSRVIADALFLEAMGVLGVSRLKRYLMYIGVRLFGFISVGKYGKSMNPTLYEKPVQPAEAIILQKKQ